MLADSNSCDWRSPGGAGECIAREQQEKAIWRRVARRRKTREETTRRAKGGFASEAEQVDEPSSPQQFV